MWWSWRPGITAPPSASYSRSAPRDAITDGLDAVADDVHIGDAAIDLGVAHDERAGRSSEAQIATIASVSAPSAGAIPAGSRARGGATGPVHSAPGGGSRAHSAATPAIATSSTHALPWRRHSSTASAPSIPVSGSAIASPQKQRPVGRPGDEPTGDRRVVTERHPHPSAPRTPVARDRQPHGAIGRRSRRVDAELPERSRAGGLDDDVGLGDQAPQHRSLALVVEVEGDGFLAGVEQVVERGGAAARTVGALRALHLDDPGAGRREQVPGERSGPQRRQIGDEHVTEEAGRPPLAADVDADDGTVRDAPLAERGDGEAELRRPPPRALPPAARRRACRRRHRRATRGAAPGRPAAARTRRASRRGPAPGGWRRRSCGRRGGSGRLSPPAPRATPACRARHGRRASPSPPPVPPPSPARPGRAMPAPAAGRCRLHRSATWRRMPPTGRGRRRPADGRRCAGGAPSSVMLAGGPKDGGTVRRWRRRRLASTAARSTQSAG